MADPTRLLATLVTTMALASGVAPGEEAGRWTAGAPVPRVAPPGPSDLSVVSCRPEGAGELRRELADQGVSVIAHLAPHRWLVAGDMAVVSSLSGVEATVGWRSAEGVAASLRDMSRTAGESAAGVVSVIAGLAPGRVPADLAGRLEAIGARVRWLDESARPVPQLGFQVSRSAVPAVVELLDGTPGLAWADVQPAVRLRNSASVWRCQSGAPSSVPIFDHGLHGEGQVIGIMDTGLDIDDCRFDDPAAGLPARNRMQGTAVNLDHRKVLAVDFYWDADWPPWQGGWDDHGHGTHVAGSAAGDDLANGTHDGVDGMAPAARLVVQDGGALVDDCADLPGLGCPVRPLEPVFEQARAQGATLHTNSWGDEENSPLYGRYTERTADVDRFMWNHKDTLVLFAAGNAGPRFDTVGSPATAKNVVAVGATVHGDRDPPCAAFFSSRGWTRDGRVKPDLLAPGTEVVSAATDFLVPSPSCADRSSSGTSMASPTVAGLAALVRQYFTDGYLRTGSRRPADGFEPSAALVKATLIASAVDLTTLGCGHEPVPSRDQGWGMVQLDTALAFAGDSHRLLVDDHRQGFETPADGAERLGVTLDDDGPLKVVLVWTDAPSSSLAATNLVNDLDLVVTGPDGVYRGNSFSDGTSVPGGDPDRINNVEVVYLPAAESGVWTFDVAPHTIPAPSQDFALVVVGRVTPVERPRKPSGRIAP